MSIGTNSLDVASLVASNLAFYNKIKPKKPTESHYYTVIATLNDIKTNKLLALATGTKASLKTYDNDIEDCHAESLLKRAYKRHVLDQLLAVISDSENKTNDATREGLSQTINKFDGRELVLFVSQFPCGLIKRFAGEEPVDEETGEIIMRKPGRCEQRDGKCAYVLRDNCFAKLRRWMSTYGYEGRTLRENLGITSRLQRIVIGDSEPDPSLDYQVHLNRMSELLVPLTATGGPQVQLHRMRHDDFVCNKVEKQPLPVATIWWDGASLGSGSLSSLEYLVDGRRLGLTKKQCESLRPEYMLRTSDSRLKSDLDTVKRALL